MNLKNCAFAAAIMATLSQLPLWSQSIPPEDVYSARVLVENCTEVLKIGKETPSSFRMGACLGYITATRQWLQLLNESTDKNDSTVLHICIPPNRVETGDIAKIIVKYGNNHPEQLYKSSQDVIMQPLYAAYPCTANKP